MLATTAVVLAVVMAVVMAGVLLTAAAAVMVDVAVSVGGAAVVVADGAGAAAVAVAVVADGAGVRTRRRVDVGVTRPGPGGVTSVPDCLWVLNGANGLTPVLPIEYWDKLTSPKLSSPGCWCSTWLLLVKSEEKLWSAGVDCWVDCWVPCGYW